MNPNFTANKLYHTLDNPKDWNSTCTRDDQCAYIISQYIIFLIVYFKTYSHPVVQFCDILLHPVTLM